MGGGLSFPIFIAVLNQRLFLDGSLDELKAVRPRRLSGLHHLRWIVEGPNSAICCEREVADEHRKAGSAKNHVVPLPCHPPAASGFEQAQRLQRLSPNRRLFGLVSSHRFGCPLFCRPSPLATRGPFVFYPRNPMEISPARLPRVASRLGL